MADLEDYPDRHPETGKVYNPLTGNWVEPDYARSEGILEQAEQHTRKQLQEQSKDEGEDSEEIDKLLKEVEDVDPGEAFEIDEDELERLDERADINHPEIPDSEFPDEEGFDPQEAETEGFEQPPTPEGLDQAASQQQNQGNYKGVYSGQNASRQQRQKQKSEAKKSMEQKHEDQEVRYVRTEQGGMKMVYPNEENDE